MVEKYEEKELKKINSSRKKNGNIKYSRKEKKESKREKRKVKKKNEK